MVAYKHVLVAQNKLETNFGMLVFHISITIRYMEKLKHHNYAPTYIHTYILNLLYNIFSIKSYLS